MDDTALPELFDTKKLQKPKFSIPPLQKKDRSGSAVFRNPRKVSPATTPHEVRRQRKREAFLAEYGEFESPSPSPARPGETDRGSQAQVSDPGSSTPQRSHERNSNPNTRLLFTEEDDFSDDESIESPQSDTVCSFDKNDSMSVPPIDSQFAMTSSQRELRSKIEELNWQDPSNKDAISRFAKRAYEKDFHSRSPSVSPVIKRTKPSKTENCPSTKTDQKHDFIRSNQSNIISQPITSNESNDDFSDDDEFNEILAQNLASQIPVQRSSLKPEKNSQIDENDDFDDDSFFEDALQSQFS